MGVSKGTPPGDAQGTKNQKINVLVAPQSLDFQVIPLILLYDFSKNKCLTKVPTSVPSLVFSPLAVLLVMFSLINCTTFLEISS